MINYLIDLVTYYYRCLLAAEDRIDDLRHLVRIGHKRAARLYDRLKTAHDRINKFSETETKIDNELVHVKDQLYHLIRHGTIDDCWYVIRYLQTSLDLWRELGYAYKGCEIAREAALKLSAARERFKADIAHTLSDRYYNEQQAYMNPPIYENKTFDESEYPC